MWALPGLLFLLAWSSPQAAEEPPLVFPLLFLIICFPSPPPLAVQCFLPIPQYVSRDRLNSLTGSGNLWSCACVLVSCGMSAEELNCVQHEVAFSHRGHPYNPPAAKPLPNTTNTVVHMWVCLLCSFLFPGNCRNTAMKAGSACDASSNIQREERQ